MIKPKYIRRVLRIRGDDSPNVRFAKWQISQGIKPTGETVVKGVLSWDEYCIRRKTWSEMDQCISLDAQFYKGKDLYLFPKEWLSRAHNVNDSLPQFTIPHPKPGIRSGSCWLGIDAAAGGDATAWCIGDKLGLLKLVSLRTPDTDVIIGRTLQLMREYAIPSENVGFDIGGGGKQHADRMRARGYNVETVGFGETVQEELEGPSPEQELDTKEKRYQYKNRRAQMYGMASDLLDPTLVLSTDCNTQLEPPSYGIPNTEEYKELIRQLGLMPKLYNEEGRLYLPPKNKRDSKDTRVTLKEIMGRSPDEADAFVVMIYMMLKPKEPAPFIIDNSRMNPVQVAKRYEPDTFYPIKEQWFGDKPSGIGAMRLR